MVSRPEIAPRLSISSEQQAALTSAESWQGFDFALGEASITDAQSYSAASGELDQIRSRASELEGMRKTITRPLDEAKKSVMDLFRTPLDRLAVAERTVRHVLLAYRTEQDRLHAEKEARIREAQRREQERLMARAAKAEAAGRQELAEVLHQQADLSIQPMAPAPKLDGAGVRETWRAEVTDLAALVQAVASGAAPASCVVADMKVLNGMARALKGSMAVPGVRAVKTTSAVAGRTS